MQRVTELLSQFSAWAVSLTAIIALISTVCKPLRSAIARLAKRMSNDRNKNEELMKEIRNELKTIKNDLSQKIDDVCGRCQILSAKIDAVESQSEVSDAALTKNMDDMRQEIREGQMTKLRYDVLDFANSCKNGRKHTQEEFEHIFEMNRQYTMLLEETGSQNGWFATNFEYIQELYKQCLKDNSFLK